jgi:hypothetical protein
LTIEARLIDGSVIKVQEQSHYADPQEKPILLHVEHIRNPIDHSDEWIMGWSDGRTTTTRSADEAQQIIRDNSERRY